MKIGFISLGCSKNLVDSEKIMGMLKEGGHTFVNHAKDAECIIINTCGFIEGARQEAKDTINEERKTVITELITLDDEPAMIYAEKFDKPCDYLKKGIRRGIEYLNASKKTT